MLAATGPTPLRLQSLQKPLTEGMALRARLQERVVRSRQERRLLVVEVPRLLKPPRKQQHHQARLHLQMKPRSMLLLRKKNTSKSATSQSVSLILTIWNEFWRFATLDSRARFQGFEVI